MMDALIAISSSFSLSIVVKATVVLMTGLLVHRLTPKFSAAVRHLALFSVFGALLVLPAASNRSPTRSGRYTERGRVLAARGR